MNINGMVSEIKRFAVHDGDGIRTTVFLKGCSLRCVWCHNPEGFIFSKQLAFFDEKCTGCGDCTEFCKALGIKKGKLQINTDKCKFCKKCEDACVNNSLKVYGKVYSPKELVDELLIDKEFFDNSGGGVTLSGGECLMQADFCAEVLKLLKQNGVNTAVDTCGCVPERSIAVVMPYTDKFLYDIKAMDEKVHIKCTGYSNKQIIENLNFLDLNNKYVEVRIPCVPDYNYNQMTKIAKFLEKLTCIRKVKLLPYHNLAGSKYKALGIKNTLPERVPTEKEMKKFEKIFSRWLEEN